MENLIKIHTKDNSDKKEKKQYCKNLALARLGETRLNTMGTLMWITKYTNADNITVEFEDGYTTTSTYKHFKLGEIKDPLDRSVYGSGYLGIGPAKVVVDGILTPQYQSWKHMLLRCYNASFQVKYPTYKSCTVADEWLNYQEYAVWYNQNYYEIPDQRMELDKDILYKGNKIYSADTCVFVPQFINSLFTKGKAQRGALPIGVTFNKGKYHASCRNNGVLIHIGSFNTPEVAFAAYKTYKEALIKDIALTYQTEIPDALYQAMMNYTVEIDD